MLIVSVFVVGRCPLSCTLAFGARKEVSVVDWGLFSHSARNCFSQSNNSLQDNSTFITGGLETTLSDPTGNEKLCTTFFRGGVVDPPSRITFHAPSDCFFQTVRKYPVKRGGVFGRYSWASQGPVLIPKSRLSEISINSGSHFNTTGEAFRSFENCFPLVTHLSVKMIDSSAKFCTKAALRPSMTDSRAKLRSASLMLKRAELLSGSWAMADEDRKSSRGRRFNFIKIFYISVYQLFPGI